MWQVPRRLPQEYTVATASMASPLYDVPHQLVYSSLTASCTHTPPPHLSHDYRPNRHVAAHIPSPDPLVAHPTRPASNHHHGSKSPVHHHCAQPPASNRPFFCLLALAYNCIRHAHGLDRAAPKDNLSALQCFLGYWPRRAYPTTTHVGIFRHSACGNLYVRVLMLEIPIHFRR